MSKAKRPTKTVKRERDETVSQLHARIPMELRAMMDSLAIVQSMTLGDRITHLFLQDALAVVCAALTDGILSAERVAEIKADAADGGWGGVFTGIAVMLREIFKADPNWYQTQRFVLCYQGQPDLVAMQPAVDPQGEFLHGSVTINQAADFFAHQVKSGAMKREDLEQRLKAMLRGALAKNVDAETLNRIDAGEDVKIVNLMAAETSECFVKLGKAIDHRLREAVAAE